MCRIILAALCITYALATTTTHKPHHSHATKEPSETDTFRFVYEGHSHKMLVINSHTCYVFTLSDAEIAGVHTDAGIRAIELKLLNSLGTAVLTATTKDQLSNQIAHACGGNANTYYMAAI